MHSIGVLRNGPRREPDAGVSRRPLTSPHGRISPEAVAGLEMADIERLNESELVRIIRAIRSAHLRRDLDERLPLLDRPTLVRLVYLTQRYCRNM